MKTKMKIATLFILLIGLLMCSFVSRADTNLRSVTYPSTIGQNGTIEIEVFFTHVVEPSGLYGDTMWLYYSINDPTVYIEDSFITVPISESKPDFVLILFDTSPLGYEIGDIFRFRINYQTSFKRTFSPLTYEITIVESTETSENTDIIDESLPQIYVPFIVLTSLIVITVIIIKIKQKG